MRYKTLHDFVIYCLLLTSMVSGYFFGQAAEIEKNAKIPPIQENLLSSWSGTSLERARNACTASLRHFKVSEDLMMGISLAESSYERFTGYNPWGMLNSNSVPLEFNSWQESCDYWAALMRYEYLDKGFITAEDIMYKYVGYESEGWLLAVRQYYD